MKQSHLFTKTRKEAPKDEISKNAELLIRAGYIHKEMAGVYAFLPLGLRVLNNIENIVRQEMNAIGGQELQMTALQDKSVWEKTDRWSDEKVDNWFKSIIRNGGETGLAFTHEEPLTRVMSEYVSSYKDLPFSVYQFQTKFRNETRAKSGIMRGREFLMKDLYSFSKNEEEHKTFYEKSKVAYMNVFRKLGLADSTYLTFASGGTFSQYSHEFQTLSEAGEDTIYVSKEKNIAINKEVFNDEVLADLGLHRDELTEMKAVEVGNIFTLGYKFSEPLGLSFSDQNGKKQPVFMGSYGIGVSRLMGTIVEVHSDDKGIVWDEAVAPFHLHLIEVMGKDGVSSPRAEELCKKLEAIGVTTLHDDRDVRPGEKFADADLIGIPWQAIISERNAADNTIEIKKRKTGQKEIVSEVDFLSGEFAKLFT